MTIGRRLRVGLLIVFLTTGCDYTVQHEYEDRGPLSPSATPAPVVLDVIEFRVSGDVSLATVRINNSVDGLSQVLTVLPYSQRVRLPANSDQTFLSVSANATGTGFLHVAIFVNGVVFREASTAAVFNPSVVISGTFRR